MVARIIYKGRATKMDQTGTSTSQFLELWTAGQRLEVIVLCKDILIQRLRYFKLGKPREREKIVLFLVT